MKIWKQILSILVSTCLVMGMLPTVSLAAEDNGAAIGTNGLCEHHTAHDETCGYVEEIEGSPCTHEHGAECYTEVISCTHTHTEDCYPILDNGVSDNVATPSEDATISENESAEDVMLSETAEPTQCSHVCSEESGCIVQELNCLHEHDENCGYVPAVEGHPCTYVCELCDLTEITEWSWVDEQELIDPESGVLALSGASAEKPVLYDEIVDMLPKEITATTEDDTETVVLDGWDCDNYPKEGAYTGSYLFNAALPNGYALAEDATALTVTVKFGGVAVLEATTHSTHSHHVCGASHTDIGDHTTGACKEITWEAWDGTSEITYDSNNTAYVYLTDNVTRDATLNVKGHTLYLCLNGYSITSSNAGDVIYAQEGAKFILCDCNGGGKITHSDGVKGRGVHDGFGSSNSATFIMYGGEISGNYAGTSDGGNDGAGVEVSGSDFTMYGGKISDNHVEKVFNDGGEISDNTSVKIGGGVASISSSVTIGGGIISGNTATSDGGGIWTYSSNVIICDESVVKNNYAANGGGVYFYGIYSSHKLDISDSVRIANNTATSDGGGVYYYCSSTLGDFLTISDLVKISQNAATNGGGIYIETSNLTIDNGSITGNTAAGNGGGVYFNGKTFKISGGADISGNTKDSASNNVYLTTDKYITITGELTGSKIRVMTEAVPDDSNYVKIAYSSNSNYADPEKFQYENDGTLSVSKVVSSSAADLVVCKHNWSTDWSTDSSNHWHECNICKGTNDTVAHVYDQEVVAEGYKASDATCTSKATYYKSCVCGRQGTETFEIGEKDSSNHSGNLSDWKSDGSEHWKEYSCCGAITEKSAHTGGTATCQNAISVTWLTVNLAAMIRQALGAKMQAVTGTPARQRIATRNLILLHTLPGQRQPRRLPRPVQNVDMS